MDASYQLPYVYLRTVSASSLSSRVLTPNESARVRTEAITRNFNKENVRTTTMGLVELQAKTQPHTYRSAAVDTWRTMYNAGLLVKQFTDLIGLGMGFVGITYLFKKYDAHDFKIDRIQYIGILILGYVGWFVFSVNRLTKDDAFFSIFKQTLKKGQCTYDVVQTLHEIDSSVCVGRISNLKRDDQYIDAISDAAIDNIHAASIFFIGQTGSHINNMLKRVFTSPLWNGLIRHPIEERHMKQQEQDKFIREVCSFFCITQDDFLSCWDIDSFDAIDFPPLLKEGMYTVARILSFFELLPPQVISEEFSAALLHEQEKACLYLRQNPSSHIAIEITSYTECFIHQLASEEQG